MRSRSCVATLMSRYPLFRRGAFLALPLALFGLVAVSTLTLHAAPDRDLTVCPAGPPQCDYAAIQPALEAAASGDKVILAPGVYTGQLTLKSGVGLESSGGPEVTVVQAAAGPIISGTGVVSATVRGIGISGQALLTGTVGIALSDSQVSLFDSVISDLHGMDARTDGDGESAVAIRSTGAGKLILDGVTIQNVTGGNGHDAKTGGDALGIVATGDGAEVTLTRTIIRQLRGGNPTAYAPPPYSCSASGGDAKAIQTSGNVVLTVSDSQVTDLTGGNPCRGQASYCEGRAGAFAGINATGGTVFVRDSLFSQFRAQPGHVSPNSYAVRTVSTQGTRLERNTFSSLSVMRSAATVDATLSGPDSPFCSPPPGVVAAISSDGDAALIAANNSINDVAGTGPGGDATGIAAVNADFVDVRANRIGGLSGGSAGLAAVGLRLDQVDSARVDANRLTDVRGEDAPEQFYYAYFGDDGGSAAGIALTGSTATLTNNVVAMVAGGAGTDMPGTDRNGGDASAMLVADSAARLWNNTLYETIPGRSANPDDPGQPGRAAGLRIEGASTVSAANNAIVGHEVGALSLSTQPVWLASNAFWDNQANYEGVAPGAGDLYVPPDFVEASAGDFHLQPGSALVDVGTTGGMAAADMDGEPRPQDGNADGRAVPDIGADEHWPGLHGSKTVDKPVAKPGDVLTYRITLAISATPYQVIGARLTDPLPVGAEYVPLSLAASSGKWSDAGGIITWTGAVSTTAPVTLTYQAKIGDVTGPLALVNTGELDDGAGARQTLRAVTVVNPYARYLPFVFLSR